MKWNVLFFSLEKNFLQPGWLHSYVTPVCLLQWLSQSFFLSVEYLQNLQLNFLTYVLLLLDVDDPLDVAATELEEVLAVTGGGRGRGMGKLTGRDGTDGAVTVEDGTD